MPTENLMDAYLPSVDDLTERARKAVEKGVNDGLFCTDVKENYPQREQAQCEEVIKGKNNAYIVLGRDRPTSIISGAGGAGYTQSGMIDLVVGLSGQTLSKEIKEKGQPRGPQNLASSNFATDAARIYMSQKCLGEGGIDNYLGLSRTTSPSAENKSGIAIKADHVRIVGRECVRIYAARGQNFQGFGVRGEKTTLGTKITNGVIELVAGREEDLQPAVLGDNLKKYLDKLIEWQSEIQKVILGILGQIILKLPFIFNIPENINHFFTLLTETINREIAKINSHDALIISGGLPLVSNTVFLT
jgi:hypothetical protein